MNKIIQFISGLTAVVLLTAGQAAAFTHFSENEFKTAESLDPGLTQTGIDFTIGDHYKSYYPEIRYGMGAMMEVGLKFGATAVDTGPEDKLGALIGADLKYQLVKETEGVPIDLAVDLSLNNTIVDSKNASELTFATIMSKSFPLTDRGYKFVPYGGLAMSALYGSLIPNDDTYMNVFAGFQWKLSQKFMVLLELKAGDQMTGGAGIRFEY